MGKPVRALAFKLDFHALKRAGDFFCKGYNDLGATWGSELSGCQLLTNPPSFAFFFFLFFLKIPSKMNGKPQLVHFQARTSTAGMA